MNRTIISAFVGLLTAVSLSAALVDRSVKCAYFDFLVGKRATTLLVADSRFPTPVAITSTSNGRYDETGTKFLSSDVTSSPQSPGVVMRSTAEWVNAGDHYLGRFEDDQGHASTVKLFVTGDRTTRSEMYQDGVLCARWRSVIADDSITSEGEFVDPEGNVVATTKETVK